MTARDFAYWLQGFFELSHQDHAFNGDLTAAQVACIKGHLAMVFKHEIDPSAGDTQHQAELNNMHMQTQTAGPVQPRC